MADATPGEQVAPQKRPGSEQAVEQPRSEPDSRSGGGPAVRGFRWWLGAIAALAFAIRLATLFTVADFTPDGGDPYWYHTQANELVAGNGFVDPFILKTEGVRVPGAQHPPLYTMWLAVPSLVGLDSYDAHKVMSCLAGVLAVAVIGLAARRVAGDRAGLIAAAVAAVYPPVWIIDGTLWPEGLFSALVALTILAAHRWVGHPTVRGSAAVGGAMGLATLTRGEAVGLTLLLVVPLVLRFVRDGWGQRFRHLVAAGLAFSVLVAPWSVRNLVQFDRFMPLSTNTDEVFVYANNPHAYGTADEALECEPNATKPEGASLAADGDAFLGFWYFPWQEYLRCRDGEPPGDVSLKAAHWRDEGTAFATDNLDRLPVVALARLGRTYDLYRPFQTAQLMRFEGRDLGVSKVGIWTWWIVAAAGIAGSVVLRRRGVTLWPLGSMVVLVTVTSVYAYGSPRFRTPVDVAAIVVAGIAVDAGLRWLARRRRDAGGAGGLAGHRR